MTCIIPIKVCILVGTNMWLVIVLRGERFGSLNKRQYLISICIDV